MLGLSLTSVTAPPTKKRAAETAADRLRQAILQEEIPAGADLPAERELAERLGVSRLTLRAAIARLEAEGLVRPVHGSGTRVLNFRESGGVDLLAYLAKQAVEGGTLPLALLRDLLELRRVVAVEVLGLVAERAGPEELRRLRLQRAEQQKLLDDPERFMKADLEFARLVVRAGHNLALELLANTIFRIIEEHPGFELAFMANARETLAVYDKVLDLIEARDPVRVQKVARRLLERLDRVTLERIERMAEQPDAGGQRSDMSARVPEADAPRGGG